MTVYEKLVRAAVPKERLVNIGTVVSPAVVFGYDSFARDYHSGGLYVKISSIEGGVREHSHDEFGFGFEERLVALRNAPFYGMAVTDENLPACLDDGTEMLLDRYPFFCRQSMICDLGRIGYAPACPDLREAMLHDLRPEIRGAAATALGRIGDKKYTGDIIEAAKNDKSAPVRSGALNALGLMKDRAALPFLRERLQDARRDIHLADLVKDRDLFMKGQDGIIETSGVVVNIEGRFSPVLEEFSQDEDSWVRWCVGKGIEYSGMNS